VPFTEKAALNFGGRRVNAFVKNGKAMAVWLMLGA